MEKNQTTLGESTVKLTKKILAITSVAVLATGSLLATPAEAQGVSKKVLIEAAMLTARGLCNAQKSAPFFKELAYGRYSSYDVVTVALKYAGGPRWESLSDPEMVTLITNQEKFSSQLDNNCLPPSEQPVFYQGPSTANRQACINQLSNQYGVFNQGQLSRCVGNRSIQDFMGGR
jgi:hypothetical protein